mmetsp:Transcript_72487/g.120871  ORF Transcript_72487/g.120871 Transcript_72487/m.120871 type:complete len:223 (+) Transcript_72487:242-910(+)
MGCVVVGACWITGPTRVRGSTKFRNPPVTDLGDLSIFGVSLASLSGVSSAHSSGETSGVTLMRIGAGLVGRTSPTDGAVKDGSRSGSKNFRRMGSQGFVRCCEMAVSLRIRSEHEEVDNCVRAKGSPSSGWPSTSIVGAAYLAFTFSFLLSSLLLAARLLQTISKARQHAQQHTIGAAIASTSKRGSFAEEAMIAATFGVGGGGDGGGSDGGCCGGNGGGGD